MISKDEARVQFSAIDISPSLSIRSQSFRIIRATGQLSSSLSSIPLELLPTDLHCFIHGLRGHLYASPSLSLSLPLSRSGFVADCGYKRHSFIAFPPWLAGANLCKHRCARHIKSIRRAVKARQRAESVP